MEKAIFTYLHERGKYPKGVADGVDSPCMEKKRRCSDPGKYRDIKLLRRVLKVLERILDGIIRRTVECDMGEQPGFRRGKCTGGDTLRKLFEKRLEGQENMAVGFIDLEEAYDTVPREMAMATLMWMAVPDI